MADIEADAVDALTYDDADLQVIASQRLVLGESSQTQACGEPAYDNRSGSWRIKIANHADLPAYDQKFGFSGENNSYEGTDLVAFLRRFCMSTLP